MGVAVGGDGEVDQRVTGQRGQHVVVEPDAGRNVRASGSVEVELDEHLRLLGLTLDPRNPNIRVTIWTFHRASTSVRADRNAAISEPVPIETRNQPSGPTTRISTPRSSRPCLLYTSDAAD